jgi:ATP-dependent DNA helicase RecG
MDTQSGGKRFRFRWRRPYAWPVLPTSVADPLSAPAAEGWPRAVGSGETLELERLRMAPIAGRPRPSRLSASITALDGVGPKLAEAAAAIGIESLGDLLWHLPHGFRDRTAIREVADLRIGEDATVMVEVKSARVRPTRRRRLRILEASVADASGPMKAIWFNQAWLAEKLTPGTRVLMHGRHDRAGFRVEAYEIAHGDGEVDGLHTTGIVPVHPASERLKPARLREWIHRTLALAADAVEPLPAELRARLGLAGVADSLRAAHFPEAREDADAARRRLAFEELFLHQAALATRRGRREAELEGIVLEARGGLTERWLESLPFSPTDGQRAAFAEIDADLTSGRPMQRLLMGEVGSGKTVVALFAMLRAVDAGHQAALMAPTETLAEQHAATLATLLTADAVPFTLLTGATSAARRRDALGRLASGELSLVVGTHALIEEDVEFARLGVAVVDEQHRFGVRQRSALDRKGPGGAAPHVLHMTATPIPRTLSLTAYGDLDATTLREVPAGRKPVKTWVVGDERRAGAYEFIRERLREGRQCYVVCPLVEGSEKLEAKAAAQEFERLRAGELADFDLELLHGQMTPAAKAAAMAAFASGTADVLVATTVIEVGIDVPNATVMLVEGAERFGLSQLHQLRGRVGRGEHESQCILFCDAASDQARRRMAAIEAERDGFRLAEVDLLLRGEGEILGTRQSGLPTFKAATLPEDLELLVTARREVLALLERHGSLDSPELGPLIDSVRLRFGDERAASLAA